MTSKKQRAANRKNARKSTGPKTEKGLAKASQNAMRHGITSHSLYFYTPVDGMGHEEFLAFHDSIFEAMQPEGTTEAILADRIFTILWRMHRLNIAETGMIRKRIENITMQRMADMMEENAEARSDAEKGVFRRMRTSHGCSQLADGWQAIVEILEEKGLPLSEGITRGLDEELGGRSGFFKAELISICNYAVKNKEQKELSKEDEEQCNKWALHYAKDLMEFFRGIEHCHEWDEKDMQQADLQSKMIPPLADVEKLQRYEAHLHRIFMQTLHELQRIQSARMGCPAPLAAALDVTLNSENGFVS